MNKFPVATLVLVGVLAGSPPAAAQQVDPTSNVQILMSQARASVDQLDYEGAVKALDPAISVLEAARPTPDTRRTLASAYELRARSRFGLGQQAESRADFEALLKVDPSYALTGQVAPRISAIFDEVAKATVTQLTLAVTPPNAEVTLDGVKIPSAGTIPVAIGNHTVTASRIGYKSSSVQFKAVAGEAIEMNPPACPRTSPRGCARRCATSSRRAPSWPCRSSSAAGPGACSPRSTGWAPTLSSTPRTSV